MLINLNGELLPAEAARVPVLDHGFLFGDSVYEVVRTANGRLFTAREHLERLRGSAAAIRLELPLTEAQFLEEMSRTHAASGEAESYLRIVVTRGVGELELHPRTCTRPTWLILAKPLTRWPERCYTRGIRVALVPIHRNPDTALSPRIKSGNYLNNVLAIMQAADLEAEEGIMLNPEGWLTEGTTSNVWLVRRGELQTPARSCGLLPGITRQLIFELAASAGLPAREARIGPQDLRAAEEVFISSTTRGVMPVRELGEHAVGAGAPGPVTCRLLGLFEARLKQN